MENLPTETVHAFRKRGDARWKDITEHVRDLKKMLNKALSESFNKPLIENMEPEAAFDLGFREAKMVCMFCHHPEANHAMWLDEENVAEDGSMLGGNVCEMCRDLGDEEIMLHDTMTLDTVQLMCMQYNAWQQERESSLANG